jgi:P-type Ca2+ transporter type 2C
MRRRLLPLGRLQELTSFDRGLSTQQAAQRRGVYGANDIVEVPGNAWLELARDTAKDPMLWFLGAAGLMYALAGQRVEAITLLAAVLPLLGMDSFLHLRTRASTQGLKSHLAVESGVIRDETPRRISSADIVPGDVVTLEPGEVLPADGVFIDGNDLQAEESVLTGEAYPVRKLPLQAISLQGADPLVDEAHWGFAGTRVLTGSGRLRVIFTGRETAYGEIVQSAIHARHETTPLQRAIQGLVRILLAAAMMLCLALAAIRLLQGYGWLDALVSAVTLATAAIPEEFPVAFTFFLGLGVYRLAKRHALVRRAVSVESIGRVSSICSDKTGTITEGRLQLTHIRPARGVEQARTLSMAAIASRRESRDPLDEAILSSGPKAGENPEVLERLATFPFTEDRKRETAIVRDHHGAVIAACKGAPEVVLRMCRLAESERNAWEGEAATFAEESHKVIAVASRQYTGTVASREPDQDYEFAGLLAFEDAIRDGVSQAVRTCGDAGIHVVMVTGDHTSTARAVASEIGLGKGSPLIISGDELHEWIRRRDVHDLTRIDVVSRATPAQKLLLVRALKECGEIVAVTGDGVNDVPALQIADIGVAMGQRGTRSAREVSAIVLLDDNFRTIVEAIREGRQLFRNLQLCFRYLLIIHIPLVLAAAAIPLAGYPLLYLPVHIVWLEIIIHPTALLVFQEAPVDEKLGRQPVQRTAKFYNRWEWVTIAATGLVIFGWILAGYFRSLGNEYNVEHARANALAIMTFASAGVTIALSRLRTRMAWIVVAFTMASTVALIQTPRFHHVLHAQPLHKDDWIFVAAGTVAATVLAAMSDLVTWKRRQTD